MRLVFPDPPQKNDALFMLGALSPKPFVRSYVQERAEVVHGPSCRKDKELYLDRCALDGVAVHRRRSGGGTVVLSPGMVITVVVGYRRKNDDARRIFGLIHDAMIAILDPEKSLHLSKAGISDLAIKGRKVLGSSLYMQRVPFLYYYQSSLMVNPDRTLFARYLAHPPREPQYRQGRPHEEFCTTLAREGCALKAAAIAHRFIKDLPGFL